MIPSRAGEMSICVLLANEQVSNDAHFKILKEVEYLRIFVVNIKDFVELLLRNQGNNHLN